jgi:hypothetical protein
VSGCERESQGKSWAPDDVLDDEFDDLPGGHDQLEAIEVGQALIGLRRLDQLRRSLRMLDKGKNKYINI